MLTISIAVRIKCGHLSVVCGQHVTLLVQYAVHDSIRYSFRFSLLTVRIAVRIAVRIECGHVSLVHTEHRSRFEQRRAITFVFDKWRGVIRNCASFIVGCA